MKDSVKVRHSVGSKLAFLMMGLIAAMIILVAVLNALFFERFYMNNRKNMLLESFQSIEELLEEVEQNEDENSDSDGIDKGEKLQISEAERKLSDFIFELKNDNNINVLIADSNMDKLYSSQADYAATLSWLREVYFNPGSSTKVIEETELYVIQQGYNRFEGEAYLEIIGFSSNSRYNIIMQIPIESIQENVKISNNFFALIGIIAVIVSGILAYIFSKTFTYPIKKLSETAQAVANKDFSVKYEIKTHDEIGALGNSINTMSDNLEEYISELKKANLELQNDIEKKEQLDVMRREFISNVSHELKTPIALIQGYAEGLKDGINEDPESMEFYCDVILDEAFKMNKMVKQLLNLNSLESGKDQISLEHFDLTKLLSDVSKANQIRAEQNGARIIFSDSEPCYVWADEFRIEEVITNYLSNAINHVEAVNGKAPEIIISTEKQDNIVRVKVFNVGKNIPESDLENVWEKFYKVDKARTREYGGSGIGLSIVKAIMEAHGRRYGVSNKDDGVEFYFELDCEKG